MKRRRAIVRSLVALVALALMTATAAVAAPDHATARSSGGDDFTVGFSSGNAASPFLKAISDAIDAVVEREGGSYELKDAQLDPNKQIADIDQLVAEGVDAIAFVAFDARLVGPALERAKDAGIKLIGFDYELNYDGEPPSSPVDGQVLDDRPQMAEGQAAYLDEVLNGQGEVAYIDLGLPVVPLRFSQETFAEELGQNSNLDFVGVFDNLADDIAGGRTQADAAMTQHPDLKAIVTFDDTTALGAARAVTVAGKEGEVVVVGTQLTPAGVKAIKAGTLTASWDSQPIEIGERLGNLIVAAVSGKPDSRWQKTVVAPAKFYDANNIDEWVRWKRQLAALREGD